MATKHNSNLTMGSAKTDEDTKAAIYIGVNQAQIMTIFRVDHKTIKEKFYKFGVKSVGKLHGSDVYTIKDAAEALVIPKFDIETYIKRMNHADLPAHVTKAFWEGLRNKQAYEKEAGLLWPTERIVEEVGELFKIIKMTTLLMLDGVERQSELTDRQKSIIQGFGREMLNEVMSRIQSKFKNPEPNVKPEEKADYQEL